MNAFIQINGITICPPMAARSWNPAKARKDDSAFQPFEQRDGPRSEQAQLACAKILAMLKLLGGSKDGTTPSDFLTELAKARSWFFEPNHDFEQWCDDAGFDPEYVRQNARKVEADRIPTASKHSKESVNITEMARYAEIRRWKSRKDKQ